MCDCLYVLLIILKGSAYDERHLFGGAPSYSKRWCRGLGAGGTYCESRSSSDEPINRWDGATDLDLHLLQMMSFFWAIVTKKTPC